MSNTKCVTTEIISINGLEELSRHISRDVQVDGTVVQFVTIPMVHYFPSFQLSAELFFGNQTMNEFSRATNPLVTFVVDVGIVHRGRIMQSLETKAMPLEWPNSDLGFGVKNAPWPPKKPFFSLKMVKEYAIRGSVGWHTHRPGYGVYLPAPDDCLLTVAEGVISDVIYLITTASW